MSENLSLDPVLERVERLLLRYEELRRTNELLIAQVETLAQERDSLKITFASRKKPHRWFARSLAP